MIVEHAHVTVKPGSGPAFEAAVAEAAATIFPRAEGYLGYALHHCIEAPDDYVLALRWRRLEDHVVGFREGPLFAEWRALVGPHFGEPPMVLHFAIIAES